MIHYEEHISKIPLVLNITYEDQRYCRTRKYFRGRSHVLYDPSDSFFTYTPLRPAESHTWTEITHCGGVNMHHHEKDVFWAYITPGSGVFMYTGKTVILRHHRFYFPGHQIHRYRKLGFDTIQYTRAGDQPCGTNAVEIIDLNKSGISACHSMLRSGYNASEMCNCVPRSSRWSKSPTSFPRHYGQKELALRGQNVCAFCTNGVFVKW